MCLDQVMKFRTKPFVFRLMFLGSGSSRIKVFRGIEGWKPEVFVIVCLGLLKTFYSMVKPPLSITEQSTQGKAKGYLHRNPPPQLKPYFKKTDYR